MSLVTAFFAARAAPHRLATGVRSIFVKVHKTERDALEKLQAKCTAEGLESRLKARTRFIKPTQQRQTDRKEAKYNLARRERERIVESALADPSLAPF